MSNHPTHPGEVVTHHSNGGVGIVTEPARKAGVYKGKVSVMWVGDGYTVVEWPEELEVIPSSAVLDIIARKEG